MTKPMMKAVPPPDATQGTKPARASTPPKGSKGARPKTALGMAPPPPMTPPSKMSNLPKNGRPIDPVAPKRRERTPIGLPTSVKQSDAQRSDASGNPDDDSDADDET